MTSYHPKDLEYGYCANCEAFTGTWTLALLEQRFPWIPWREPILVNGRYGCRLCISNFGLRGIDVKDLPPDRAGWEQHWKEQHGNQHLSD